MDSNTLRITVYRNDNRPNRIMRSPGNWLTSLSERGWMKVAGWTSRPVGCEPVRLLNITHI